MNTGKPNKQTFGTRKDLGHYKNYQAEFFLKVFPKVVVYQRPKDLLLDTLYREVVNEKKLEWVRYDYPASLILKPQEAELKKMGIEKWRDCQFTVSIPLLEKYKFPLPSIDSVFFAEGEFYKITDVVPINYITSTGTPLNLALLGLKYRPSSTEVDEIPELLASKTLFFPEHDIKYVSSAFSEFNVRNFTYVQFIDRNRDSRDFDVLYLEDVEDWKTKGVRYQIPCYVRIDPQKKTLKKFGIDTDRDIYISLSKELSDKFIPRNDNEVGSLSSKYPDIGTVVIVEEESYIITDALPQYYFGNTYSPSGRSIGIMLFGKKLRSSTLDFREKVFDSEKEPEPELPPYLDGYL